MSRLDFANNLAANRYYLGKLLAKMPIKISRVHYFQ